MNRAIKNIWLVSIVLFMFLFGAITYTQFFFSPPAELAGYNTRGLYKQYGSYRGSIIVDGEPIAYSEPSADPADPIKYQRIYKNPELYAPLTGYYSFSYGSSGLEAAESETLSGTTENSQFLETLTGQPPQGSSIELTLNSKLQEIAYEGLKGKEGAVVATNPKTGEILAMVSTPSYDPNTLALHNQAQVGENIKKLQADDLSPVPLNNSGATGKLYAPGSVFKIIDTAAALESGQYDENSVLENPQELSYPGTGYSLVNYVNGNCRAKTKADFAFVIAQSCNTPFADIATTLGENVIAAQAEKFGFDAQERLKIPFPVVNSEFPRGLSPSELAQSSIGQFNVKATPLEINMMTSAIANDGKQMKPNMIGTVRSADFKVLSEFTPKVLRTSTTPEIAHHIREWMVGTVDNGLGRGAKVDGVEIAAKTGTAELLAGKDLINSWFTGFAPANDPQIAITVVVTNVSTIEGNQITQSTSKKLFEAVLKQQ